MQPLASKNGNGITLKRKLLTFSAIALLAIAAFATWEHGQWDIAQLQAYIEEHSVAGSIACIGAFAVSTVLPVSALPLLPLAARAYGVWTTVLLTMTGWWIGCIAAFVIARWARVFLERVTSLEATRRLEAKLPSDVGFSGIVVLRVIFPGDLVGFALGLLKHVRFSTYAGASLVGTIPSAVVFSFAGGELGKGHFASSALLVAAMLVGTLLLKRLWPDRSRVRASAEDRA
jgi:uncharacterized membrane protein YdjX (TVP38/TMEM64 family)